MALLPSKHIKMNVSMRLLTFTILNSAKGTSSFSSRTSSFSRRIATSSGIHGFMVSPENEILSGSIPAIYIFGCNANVRYVNPINLKVLLSCTQLIGRTHYCVTMLLAFPIKQLTCVLCVAIDQWTVQRYHLCHYLLLGCFQLRFSPRSLRYCLEAITLKIRGCYLNFHNQATLKLRGAISWTSGTI